jgi:hypothetical protein
MLEITQNCAVILNWELNYHPDSRHVIEATIKAWNTSTMAGEQMKLQNQEIVLLRV